MDFWRILAIGPKEYAYVSLAAADEAAGGAIARLPACLKCLIENVLRHSDDTAPLPLAARTLLTGTKTPGEEEQEITFHPSRVLMPDSSGLPLIADLAALRDAAVQRGLDPGLVNPRIPVDLVVDHSLIVDQWGTEGAAEANLRAEITRNDERYRLVKWAERAFDGLRVVPPGNGICHQLNLERLARVVVEYMQDDRRIASFETLVGMDSHTPMINCLGVVGWGVGGIEAATAMLGEPIGLTIPRVVGCRLVGRMPRLASTTDLALAVTERLRRHGVVGAFVEYYGPGAASLALPQRATLSNMAPEYGATLGFFSIDRETLRYLEMTGRSPDHLTLVEAYARAQGVWTGDGAPEPIFTEIVEIDLATLEPSAAGPARPQDRMALSHVPESFESFRSKRASVDGSDAAPDPAALRDGAIVVAAITSCTNTSNPSVMMEAGLLARNAAIRGLKPREWVKTSLAPGSRVVADYLHDAGLQPFLDALGFSVAGYGCTTCMGNSGSLHPMAVADIEKHKLQVCAVLSGNRNFEGRIHNAVAANYLMSPALVVAYALAGTITIDLTREPLGTDREGRPVFLEELRPAAEEVEEFVRRHVTRTTFETRYADGFRTPEAWSGLDVATTATLRWKPTSTYIRKPPFLELDDRYRTADIVAARALLILGDTVTTDHISPVSRIRADSAAGRYLLGQGVNPSELDSFMSRRANHDVMLRGTFANPHLVNEMAPDARGGITRYQPGGDLLPVHEAAARYAAAGTPLIVIAGAAYGTGSSRDWAAKGSRLLGIRAIVAEGFERIHRSNLVGLGILPLEFPPGVTRHALALDGCETYDLSGLTKLAPRQQLAMTIRRTGGETTTIALLCRVDTERELAWYMRGGILPLALEKFAA